MNINVKRKELSDKYIKGTGIEIGALHQPLDIPKDVNIKYVDKLTSKELRAHYPELAQYEFKEADIVDNGEFLFHIRENTLDFVIANHFIEHCQDPILTLENHLRVLKTNGMIYMAVPDRNSTFDKNRPITSLKHIRDDYHDGAGFSKREHYIEWGRLVNGDPDDKMLENAQKLIDKNYSIHFHVWDKNAFMEVLNYCVASLKFPFVIEAAEDNKTEYIFILRKI